MVYRTIDRRQPVMYTNLDGRTKNSETGFKIGPYTYQV